MKKFAWALLAAVLLAAGFLLVRHYRKGEQAPKFQETRVERHNLEITVLATGIVQPENRLELKPPIPGRVESILVEEGQRVQKGQILAWLSSSERAALLDAARAKGSEELRRWEGMFKPTPLLAPLNGLIIVRNVVPGQVVAAADVVLVMSDYLIVNTQVDETDIAQVKLGQVAQINLDAYPKELIPGKVTRVGFESKTVNNVTIYEVRVLPQRSPDFMRSGMTANVKFISELRPNVLVVPTSAVKEEQGRTTVLLPDPSDPDRQAVREVRLGLSDGKRYEVLGGLTEGETVLVPVLPKIGEGGPRPSNPFSPLGSGAPRR